MTNSLYESEKQSGFAFILNFDRTYGVGATYN